MSLLSDVILAPDTTSNRPAATAVPTGTLFYSTDDGKVYRSNGSTWDDYSSAGGGSGAITVVNKTLDNSELLALGGTPIELLAAPGADMVLVPTGLWVFQSFVTAYSFGRAWKLVNHGSSNQLWGSGTSTDEIGDKMFILTPTQNGAGFDSSDAVNTALDITLNSTHSSGGNAANFAIVSMSYFVANWS